VVVVVRVVPQVLQLLVWEPRELRVHLQRQELAVVAVVEHLPQVHQELLVELEEPLVVVVAVEEQAQVQQVMVVLEVLVVEEK
jgi:hypothetical protein